MVDNIGEFLKDRWRNCEKGWKERYPKPFNYGVWRSTVSSPEGPEAQP